MHKRRTDGGIPVLNQSAIEALLEAAPRPVSGVAARRVSAGGHDAWVFHNPATGHYFQATPALYLLAAGLDGKRTVRAALTERGCDPAEAETLMAGLAGMLNAGLLHVPGLKSPSPARPGGWLAPLRQLAFTRWRLGDLVGVMPVAEPLLGWLFTRFGALALAALLGMAALAWSSRGAELAEQTARIADLDMVELAVGYLIFIAVKLLHETGHGVAARRMAMAEGHRVGVLPWGLSFMFLLPAPFVDASSTWFLQSRGRRALVGLAGVATDLLVAALAALLWAGLGPGILRDRAFDLVLICGISSLVFNLNPLVRLDGYYVLSDLLGIANLATRAQAALGRLLLGPLGLASRPSRADIGFGLYGLASWTYRWTIYLGIFWLAGGVHWMLAMGVAGVVALLFLLVPLARLLAQAPGAFARAPIGGGLALALAGGIAGTLLLLPVAQHVEAEGVVVQEGLTLVYPRADGLLLAAAPPGEADGQPVIRLENPETARLLLQLGAEAEAAAIELRRARAGSGEGVNAALERSRAVATQIAALQAERAGWEVRAPDEARWEPLRAATLVGAWLRRDDTRPLGVMVAPGPREIRLVLDQWDGPLALQALASRPEAPIPMRLRGATAAQFEAVPLGPAIEARDSLPSPALASAAGGRIPARIDAQGEARPMERVFEVRLRPDLGAAPATETLLRHGARVQARIALAPAPLAAQLWRRARQTLQRRLAV
jgi:putative peptide zinc metalloprotease protein